VVKKLAGEYAGQPVVFLEYLAGNSEGNRETRFQAAFRPSGYSVPMAIVASGFRYSQGSVDYHKVFKAMIDADRARAPQAEIQAWWRRADATTLRLYATVHNTSDLVLDNAGNESGVWGLAWETKATLGVTGMYTRKAVRAPMVAPVPPGATTSVVMNLPIISVVDWNNLHAVVAAETRPGGTAGPYDMLQAVIPREAGFSVEPEKAHLQVPQGPGAAEVRFLGPHVLVWSGSTSSNWLSVTPAQGTVAESARVEVRPDLLQPGQQVGTVTFTATSEDGMSFTATVAVTATFDANWSRSHLLPRRHLPRAAPTQIPR
jgi:hypothetical protein